MPVDPRPKRSRPSDPAIIRVGVIADTHGYLNPQVLSIFNAVDRIIHAGDIESPQILSALARVAPLDAIRGNMDFGNWAAPLPREDMLVAGEVTIYALHDLTRLSLNPRAAGIQVVVSGHTHQTEASWRDACLYLNPGSASLPRYGQAPSVAILEIRGLQISHRFIALPET